MFRPIFDPIKRSVMVTGCSSGIGRATAELLKMRGWRVFPTARKDEDLASLKAAGFEPVRLDTADEGSVKAAVERVLDLCEGAPGALVNNAGVAQYGAVEDLTRTALRHQLEVNTIGAQDLTNRLIPYFRERHSGRIVNVSSVYGRVTAPMVGAYCASKYAMEALSDAMRVELRGEGIAVALIEPGPIQSRFRANSADLSLESIETEGTRYGNRYERRLQKAKREQKVDWFTRPPEAVAVKVAHALESRRPHSRYCVTIPAYFGAFLRRTAPDWLMDRLFVKSARV